MVDKIFKHRKISLAEKLYNLSVQVWIPGEISKTIYFILSEVFSLIFLCL